MTPTLTITDHEGCEYEMWWASAFPDTNIGCDFCDQTITEGWVNGDGDILFILCDDCAKANS